MNVKVYFKSYGIFSIILFILITLFLLSFSFIICFEFGEILPSLFTLIMAIIMAFSIYCSKIYGIRIKNNKLRIISQYKVRFCDFDDVEKIEIKFIKEKKYYNCYASLYMDSGKKIDFEWDELRSSKWPHIDFKITEEDVYKYKELLSVIDKINVEII